MATSKIVKANKHVEVSLDKIVVSPVTSGTTFEPRKCYMAGDVLILNGQITQNTAPTGQYVPNAIYIYKSDFNVSVDGRRVIGCTGTGTNDATIGLAAFYIDQGEYVNGVIRTRMFSKSNSTSDTGVYMSLYCLLE